MSPLDWLTSESQGCSCLCFLCAGVATVVSILHCVSFLQLLRYSLPPDHSSLSILCALFLNFLSLHSAACMCTDVGSSPGIWEASLGRHSWRNCFFFSQQASLPVASWLLLTPCCGLVRLSLVQDIPAAVNLCVQLPCCT